jgi:glutaredoxin-like protein
MGMLVGKEDLGFGLRSWRYSMLVRDGIIEKMFIEPEEPGDPYHVSDADTMLNYLAPQATKPLDATILSREGCPFCVKAKGLLRDAGIEFEELVLNRDFSDRTLRAIADATTYPQVFVNGQQIGGAEDLEAWLVGRRAA